MSKYIHIYMYVCMSISTFIIYIYLSLIYLSIYLSIFFWVSIPLKWLNYIPFFVVQIHHWPMNGRYVSCTYVCIFSSVISIL